MNEDKYLGKIDKIFFICCTDGNRENSVKYMINRLFGDYAEIHYTACCELSYLNYIDLMNYEKNMYWFNDYTKYATVNCLLEHYKCIKQAYNRGFDRVMICEDDFRIMPEKEEYFKLAIQNLPEDGDIIKLHTWTQVPELEVDSIDDNNTDLITYNDYYYKLVNLGNKGYLSMNCNIYNRKGMETMLKWIESAFHAADRYFHPIFFPPFKTAILNNEINFYHIKDNDLVLATGSSIIGYYKKEKNES